jgi:hypothetical protein
LVLLASLVGVARDPEVINQSYIVGLGVLGAVVLSRSRGLISPGIFDIGVLRADQFGV